MLNFLGLFGKKMALLLAVCSIFSNVQSCNTGEDCGDGYSCIDNVCIECLTCNMLFRKGNSCILDFKECGDCLDGYEEIAITEFSSAIKPCQSKKTKYMTVEGCTSSDNCLPNNYCKDGFCFRCFNCTTLNRHEKSFTEECPKWADDCGLCMEGYYEVGKSGQNCERISITSEKNPPAYVHIVILLGLVLVCLFIGLVIKAINGCDRDREQILPV